MSTENNLKLRNAARKNTIDGESGVKHLATEVLKIGGPEDLDYADFKPYYRSALWEAAWKNHLIVARFLLEKGANPNVLDFEKRSPLHEAAYGGHEQMVELLVEKSSDINAQDEYGETPLMRAVSGGRYTVAKLLVEKGADANNVTNEGVTVAHIAAYQGKTGISNWLFYKGAWKNRFAIPFESSLAPDISTSISINLPAEPYVESVGGTEEAESLAT